MDQIPWAAYSFLLPRGEVERKLREKGCALIAGKAVYDIELSRVEVLEKQTWENNELRWAIEKSRVKSSFQVDSEDIEVVLRRKEGKDYLFFLNHSAKSHQLKLDQSCLELLERREYSKDSVMAIEPKGVRIICKI